MASTHDSREYVSRYICRRPVVWVAVHNHTKHVSTPARHLAHPFSTSVMALLAPGIRIDGFTGRFRLYAWDNGRRSEPLFAAGQKYASVFAPFFHGNAPEPTPEVRRLFLHFRQRERRFLSPSALSAVARRDQIRPFSWRKGAIYIGSEKSSRIGFSFGFLDIRDFV